MKTIAIITARGGSKRIPRKNVKEFCGKPILAYSIEAAIESGIFDTVMVSTDDQEIADIAKEYGAEVPFLRSEETSNDFATTNDVLKEVIQKYEESGTAFDVFCCIYPTAPFITPETLKNAYMEMSNDSADSVVPVVKFSFPPQRAFIIRNNYVEYLMPENAKKRSQDLEPHYHDCGQFYFCKVKSFKEQGTIITDKTKPIIVDERMVQDIDTMSDWEIAEAKYRALHR